MLDELEAISNERLVLQKGQRWVALSCELADSVPALIAELRASREVIAQAKKHDMAIPAALARLEASNYGGVAYSLRLWRDSLALALTQVDRATVINAKESGE